MRIAAFLLSYPPRRRNGAFLTMHDYLSALVEHGHDVHVVTSGDHASYVLEGVHVHPRGVRPLVRTAGSFDVVLWNHGYDGGALAAAQRSSIGGRRCTTVLMVHGEDRRLRRLPPADLTWFPTEATRDWYNVARRKGRRHVVINPPVDPRRFEDVSPKGAKVTLIGDTVPKGLDVLALVARALPRREFLVVESAFDRRARRPPLPPNVEVIANTDDMAEVYSQTRVLLMPSTTETFGRVGLEAMSCGIPVVASQCKGMVEAFGSGALFLSRRDVGAWVWALRTLLENKGEWLRASNRAWARAAELNPDDLRKQFVSAIEEASPLS